MAPTPCAPTFSAALTRMARRPIQHELLGRQTAGLVVFVALAMFLSATPVAALGDGTRPGAGAPLCQAR